MVESLHDIEAEIPENDPDDHFYMRDYHLFPMENNEKYCPLNEYILNSKLML